MRKVRLLVIDDSPLICNIIEKVISEEGMAVHSVFTGEEGIAYAQNHQPELILLDIVLANMSGFDVFKMLKSDKRTENIPVIFITSTTDSQNVVKCFELGAVDYIAKPFSPLELKARVKVHLENQRSQKALKKMMDELMFLANNDYLTGLYNRRYFISNLEALTKKTTDPIMIILGDLDDFKKINDIQGHAIGDQVLASTSRLMKEYFSNGEIVARWGGEEFIISLACQSAEKAVEIVDELRKQISQLRFQCPDGGILHPTITFGITKFDLNETIEKNISFADIALYKGKANGKNCCVLYEKE